MSYPATDAKRQQELQVIRQKLIKQGPEQPLR